MLYNGILTKLDNVRNDIITAIQSKGGVIEAGASLKDCKAAIAAMPNWGTNNTTSQINPVFNGLMFYLGCDSWMKDEISGNEIAFTNVVPKTGKHNQCAYFDGSNASASISKDLASIRSKTAWSIAFWFKPEALTNSTINPIYSEWNESNYGSSRFSVQLTNDLKVFSQVNFTDGQEEVDLFRVESPSALNTDNWYHIAAVIDLTSKTAILYLNGIAVATASNPDAPDAAPDSLPYVDPQIMSWMDDMKYYTHGSLDELAMWNKALTASEVSILYRSGNGLFYPDTVSVGDTATDIYKCQAVSEDKTTWSGYPCTYHEGEKRYYVSSQVVDGLTCTGPLTPAVGNYYDYRCRYACYVPYQGDGLLAYFPLTRDVKDHSGNGHHAEPTGPLEFHTIYGVSTNRNDDATLTFPALESIKGFNVSDGDFTFSFWYRMRVRGNQQRIMIDKKSMNESKFMFAMWDSRFRFNVLDSCKINNTTYESGWTDWSEDIPINQIVITRLTDVIYIYRNAECISNFGATGKVFDIVPYLGQYSYDRGCNSYTYISDMRMYSTGMSAEQVQNMYQVGRFNGI